MVQKHIVISMIAPVAVAGILIMTILSVTDGVNKFGIVSRGAIYEGITKVDHKQVTIF